MEPESERMAQPKATVGVAVTIFVAALALPAAILVFFFVPPAIGHSFQQLRTGPDWETKFHGAWSLFFYGCIIVWVLPFFFRIARQLRALKRLKAPPSAKE